MEKNFKLSELKADRVVELDGWKQKQNQVVAENPFVTITDSKSYEQAKKNRTALKSARTEVEKQDRLIGSTLSSFRKETKAIAEDLISITVPHEEKQQDEVSRHENIIEQRKKEKELLESKRIENIQAQIDSFGVEFDEISNRIRPETIQESRNLVHELIEKYTKFQYEEYQILFDQKLAEKQDRYNEIVESVVKRQKEKEEHERLVEENKKKDQELQKLRDEQAERLKADNEKSRIDEIEQGILDRIHQMHQGNVLAEQDSILNAIGSQEPLIKSNESHWLRMSGNIKITLQNKCEIIKRDVEKQEAATKAEDERMARVVEDRSKELIRLGMKETEEGDFIGFDITISVEDVYEAESIDDLKLHIDDAKYEIDKKLKDSEVEKKRQQSLKIDKVKILGLFEEASDEITDTQFKFENEEMQLVFLEAKGIIEAAFEKAHDKVKNF